MPHRIPTVDEMDEIEDANGAFQMLGRLAACLRDGAAILSREDREQGYRLAMKAMHLKDVGLLSDAMDTKSKARQRLQLEQP